LGGRREVVVKTEVVVAVISAGVAVVSAGISFYSQTKAVAAEA